MGGTVRVRQPDPHGRRHWSDVLWKSAHWQGSGPHVLQVQQCSTKRDIQVAQGELLRKNRKNFEVALSVIHFEIYYVVCISRVFLVFLISVSFFWLRIDLLFHKVCFSSTSLSSVFLVNLSSRTEIAETGGRGHRGKNGKNHVFAFVCVPFFWCEAGRRVGIFLANGVPEKKCGRMSSSLTSGEYCVVFQAGFVLCILAKKVATLFHGAGWREKLIERKLNNNKNTLLLFFFFACFSLPCV